MMVMLRLIGFKSESSNRISVYRCKCDLYKAVRFERMMPLFHLYRGLQLQFTEIIAVDRGTDYLISSGPKCITMLAKLPLIQSFVNVLKILALCLLKVMVLYVLKLVSLSAGLEFDS